jgi:hypothetical protein
MIVKKVLIVSIMLILALTGCNGGTKVTAPDKDAPTSIGVEIPIQDSKEGVVKAFVDYYVKGDFEKASQLVVPSYFADSVQKTPMMGDWVEASKKSVADSGVTYLEGSVTRTGELNKLFSINITGVPKDVMEVQYKVKDKDGKEVTLDPTLYFPVQQKDKWYIVFQGDLSQQQVKQLKTDAHKTTFDVLTDASIK